MLFFLDNELESNTVILGKEQKKDPTYSHAESAAS